MKQPLHRVALIGYDSIKHKRRDSVMKAVLSIALVSLLAATPVLADGHKDKGHGGKSGGDKTSECNQWANERGLKGQERKHYVDRCTSRSSGSKDWDKDWDGDKDQGKGKGK